MNIDDDIRISHSYVLCLVLSICLKSPEEKQTEKHTVHRHLTLRKINLILLNRNKPFELFSLDKDVLSSKAHVTHAQGAKPVAHTPSHMCVTRTED